MQGPHDKRERAGRERPVCWNETLSEEKPDQGCVQKSLLHNKNNRERLEEVVSKDEVRGAGSLMVSGVPQAAVQRTNQREDSMVVQDREGGGLARGGGHENGEQLVPWMLRR